MVIPRPPVESLVDTIVYEKITGKDDYQKPQYDAPITVSNVRIDRTTKYSYTSDGRDILWNAVIFCYTGLSKPMQDFTEESRVTFDGKGHIIRNVLKNCEPYSPEVYSIELEVV
jgi:hypothetical protein